MKRGEIWMALILLIVPVGVPARKEPLKRALRAVLLVGKREQPSQVSKKRTPLSYPLWQLTFPETDVLDIRATSRRFFAFYRRPAFFNDPIKPRSSEESEEMVVVNRRTGAVVWRQNAPDCDATADERYVYLLDHFAAQVTLRALDWETGRERWHRTLPGNAGMFCMAWTLPNKPGRVFYITETSDDTSVSTLCLDAATGAVGWQIEGRRYYIGAALDRLYYLGFGRDEMVLYQVSPETGRALPEDPQPMSGLTTWSPETIAMEYLPQWNLYVFEETIASTGLRASEFFITDARFKTLWGRDGDGQGGYSGTGKPEIIGDIVAFSNHAVEGQTTSIEADNLHTGKRLWRRRVKSKIWEVNEVAGIWRGSLIVEQKDKISAWRPKDGKILWSVPTHLEGFPVSVHGPQLMLLELDEKKHSCRVSAYGPSPSPGIGA